MAGTLSRFGDLLIRIAGMPFRLSLVERGFDWCARKLLQMAVPLGRALTRRRTENGTLRGLWGTTPILTLPLKAEADGLLGIRSESIVWTTYVITRRFDRNLRWLPAVVGRINPDLLPALGRVVLAWAILRYDIFHYFNDRGLMWPTARLQLETEELEWLAKADKRTYVFVYGADIRTRKRTEALGQWNFCIECPEPGRFCICDDELGDANIAAVMQRVTAMVTMADMEPYMKGARRLDYWPIDIESIKVTAPSERTGPLRVAHAPNHPHFKGTRHLEAAIATLQKEGHAIVLSRVSGVPNEEVIRLFEEADVIADQFIGGAYGYTALEAMARGKPVISYVRSPDIALAADECPLIQATPDTLLSVLRWCLANRDQLARVGRQGRSYVEKHHNISAVAGRLAALYSETGQFPEPLQERWAAFRKTEASRQASIVMPEGWVHPFGVAATEPVSGNPS